MKTIVTGVNGQLGYDLVFRLLSDGHTVIGTDLVPADIVPEDPEEAARYRFRVLDITDSGCVMKLIDEERPDAVIHCAAWTAVDAAEDEDKKEKVFAVNVSGTGYLAEACRAAGAKMVYISTDYVFNGKGSRPWDPDSKEFEPLNEYGRTKLEGERRVASQLERFFIVRTSWVFGIHGNNFVKTMLRVGKNREQVTVVCDQIGTPTYTKDLADLIAKMIGTEKYGYYHASNSECRPGEYISWADFTEEIYRQAGYATTVKRVTTEQYGLSKAARPENSRLDKTKLTGNGFAPLPDWKDALRRYLVELDMEKNNGTDQS